MKSASALATSCPRVGVLLLSGSLGGFRSAPVTRPPSTPVSSLNNPPARSRPIQGLVVSLPDSVSAVAGAELLFHQLGPDSLVRSWRALTQQDGSFYTILPVGNRYRVTISCETRYVATAELELRAAATDSSALRPTFYVPCHTPEAIQEPPRRLYFAPGKATLSPKAVQTLRYVQRALQATTPLAVRLEGHAASQEVPLGQPAARQYLLRLGQRRAQAAYAYLLRAGIPANRLSVRSFGNQRPLVPDSVADALLFNPRVEFRVVAEVPTGKGLPLRSAAVPSHKPATSSRTRTQRSRF